MDATSQIEVNKKLFAQMGLELAKLESQVSDTIIKELTAKNPGRDRGECDKILGDYYTRAYLAPCISKDSASRVAHYGSYTLIPIILELEQRLTTEFHKGAIFYNTALAFLMSGNEDGFEYYLAMADEEDFKTTAGTHKRGTLNLKSGGIAGQTIVKRIEFACELLNGATAGHAATYKFMTGAQPVTPASFDAWRQSLDSMHQFELLRVTHDIEVFLPGYYSSYGPVADNPFVMLRLAKALSHLAQWGESCLTDWQGRSIKGALGKKLQDDPSFAGLHNGTHADKQLFAGNSPHGPDVDNELRQLLADVITAPAQAERNRHLLRIFYIVRNSTAHTIEPTLKIYTDRKFLLELMQAVFVSVFVICQLKGKQLPN